MAQVATTLIRKTSTALTLLGVVLFGVSTASAGPLDEMSLERWAKLKEAERFQLTAAEKFYRERHFKVAADEYEKFLKLYERSEGAPFAQLKWSHCQVELRKLNSAIKDGYQSLLDYYPESPEAPIAGLLIGRTYRDMGDTKLAKKAYAKAIASYRKHFATVIARLDLVEMAAKENDLTTQSTMLRQLTYEVERKGPTVEPCNDAARRLARLSFQAGSFDEGLKALATTCAEDDVPVHLMHGSLGRLADIVSEMTGAMDETTKKNGEKLADAAAGWLKIFASTRLTDEMRKARAVLAWFDAAEVRRRARQPDKQKAVYEEMLKSLGADDEILKHLAQWYKDNKQMEMARTTYRKFKNAAEGEGLVAASYAEEKQYDKAVAIYRKLEVDDPKSGTKWLSAAATAYRQGGKPDQAIAIYSELIMKDAANASTYQFETAETLYYAHRWKECITTYRGTDRFPHNYQHMAEANRQLKQFDEAITLYQQIIAGSPPHASWAQYEIATTYELAGKKEDAIKAFKRVCDKYPKSTQGSQAHLRLNETYKIPVTLGGAKD